MPTINIAHTDPFRTQTGRFYRLKVAGRDLRILVANDYGTVTEVRTGRCIGDIEAIKVERMARISSYTKTTDRQAAEILVERIVERLGADKFWAIIDAEKTVNP